MWNFAINSILNKDIALFGPTSFQDYAANNGFIKVNTAASISIDSFERLPLKLKTNDTMVLRLGSSPTGTGTQFALVRVKNKLKDYFLIDEEIFKNKAAQPFIPKMDTSRLLSYQIMPSLSETSLVNLALTSGLISHSLGIDKGIIPATPTTGKSAFSFELKAHSKISKILTHNNGQVEIDAVFVEKRKGRKILFIIEAKTTEVHRSLAKHKLVYPILALAQNIPGDIPIIPVYLKIIKNQRSYSFHVVECEFPDPRVDIRGIDELKVKSHCHYTLTL